MEINKKELRKLAEDLGHWLKCDECLFPGKQTDAFNRIYRLC